MGIPQKIKKNKERKKGNFCGISQKEYYMIISVKADFKILEVIGSLSQFCSISMLMLYNNKFTTKSPKGNHETMAHFLKDPVTFRG